MSCNPDDADVVGHPQPPLVATPSTVGFAARLDNRSINASALRSRPPSPSTEQLESTTCFAPSSSGHRSGRAEPSITGPRTRQQGSVRQLHRHAHTLSRWRRGAQGANHRSLGGLYPQSWAFPDRGVLVRPAAERTERRPPPAPSSRVGGVRRHRARHQSDQRRAHRTTVAEALATAEPHSRRSVCGEVGTCGLLRPLQPSAHPTEVSENRAPSTSAWVSRNAGLTSLPRVGATEGPKNRDRTVR